MWTSIVRSVLSTFLLTHLVAGAPSAVLVERQSTCNTATNRACWSNGYNINTDYEANTPFTGNTKSYTLTVTEVNNFAGPDGVVKTKAMLINGKYPGPVLTADWGDILQITVVNNLATNGTSFHWHGIRQLNNAINDGANGITECPIPPGSSKVYTFLAQQYGTTWYHSHFGVQYGNGVTGSIVINGPASANYDIDLGAYPVTDWYHGAADAMAYQIAHAGGVPPPSDNVLFNGSNINPAGTGGAYNKVTLTPGKVHRLRIINPSTENNFQVSLVGHNFNVIQTDFVPVTPLSVSSLFVGIGQRYDVLITANQAVGNYWFNVTYSGTGACGTSNNPAPASIFSYTGAPAGNPTTPGTKPADTYCSDNTNFAPVVSRTVSTPTFPSSAPQNFNITFSAANNPTVFWNVNGNSMQVQWGNPTLAYVRDGNSNFPVRENLVTLNTSNVWSTWVINNFTPIPHPMHLHGHDFEVLGSSPAQSQPFGAPQRIFNPSTDASSLKLNNPTRRDVTMLPGNGWLVVSFQTDNPGAWLFHCHIAWHVSSGLSVQYLERPGDISKAMNLNQITQNCNNWNAYYPSKDPYTQQDSGL